MPIPGTRRIERVQENLAATTVALSADEVADLDGLATRVGVRGNRYDDAGATPARAGTPAEAATLAPLLMALSASDWTRR